MEGGIEFLVTFGQVIVGLEVVNDGVLGYFVKSSNSLDVVFVEGGIEFLVTFGQVIVGLEVVSDSGLDLFVNGRGVGSSVLVEVSYDVLEVSLEVFGVLGQVFDVVLRSLLQLCRFELGLYFSEVSCSFGLLVVSEVDCVYDG